VIDVADVSLTHPRFAGAGRARVAGDRGAFIVVVAAGLWVRLAGLARLRAAEIEPLLFLRCSSIHTFWMKAPIDVAWLEMDRAEAEATVLAIEPCIEPRRFSSAPRGAVPRKRVAALELVAGSAPALGVRPEGRLEIRAFEA
jgi:hypothetical protein